MPKELSENEKQQLALLAAKIVVENRLDDYNFSDSDSLQYFFGDLYRNYSAAMEFYNNKFAKFIK
jgi:hypothetical protein